MKINLHAHSNYSDGVDTLTANILEYKKAGYDATAITDHVYPSRYYDEFFPTLTKEMFTFQRIELCKLKNYLNCNVFQGIELCLNCAEILVFGDEVIFGIYDLTIDYNNSKDCKDENNFYNNLLNYIKNNKDKCAVILCHPAISDDLYNEYKERFDLIFEIVDGYERYNGGVDHYKKDTKKYLEKLNIPFYDNTDSHILEYHLNKGQSNIINENITTNDELIKYIQSRKHKGVIYE